MRLKVASTSLSSRGADIRIVSVQNIESELGGADFDAWRDLIRVLTHEIMNTLTQVASLSQLIRQLSDEMASKIGDDERGAGVRAVNKEINDCADALSARAQTLLRFVDAYRELARLPPPSPARVVVAPLLARLATLFEGADGPGLSLSVPSDVAMLADPAQVEQAVLNLLTNARDAQRTAGVQEDIEIVASRDVNGVAIAVADRGAGVPKDVRERIFTPFFSTKPGGSGVGLSLVRQIALANGGAIDFQPRRGGGAVFTLHLPAG
jgi:signal transduction histidine kinase